MSEQFEKIRSTTVIAVKKDGKVAIAAITFTMPLEYSYNESDLVVVE